MQQKEKIRPRKGISTTAPAAIALAAVIATLIVAPAVHAERPLVTEESGTLGKGKGKVEIGCQIWHHEVNSDAATAHKEEGIEIAPVMTVGLHDRLDVAASVPYRWLSLEADGASLLHASGGGDIGLDLKWRFFETDGWSLAIKPGISLPTGDQDKDLGCGRTIYRTFFIVSKGLGSLNFHMNLGYTRNENNTGDRENLWHTSFAIEYEIAKNLRIMADVGAGRNPIQCEDSHPTYALGGLAYAFSERFSVDGGVKFGLNKSETDISYLFGLTVKF